MDEQHPTTPAPRPDSVANHVAVELCVASVFSEQLKGLTHTAFMHEGVDVHLPLHFWLVERPADGLAFTITGTADGQQYTSPLNAETRRVLAAAAAEGDQAMDMLLTSGCVIAAEGLCSDPDQGIRAQVLARAEPLLRPADGSTADA